jgi:hypothetical protein
VKGRESMLSESLEGKEGRGENATVADEKQKRH